jgi:hypothetical protein
MPNKAQNGTLAVGQVVTILTGEHKECSAMVHYLQGSNWVKLRLLSDPISMRSGENNLRIETTETDEGTEWEMCEERREQQRAQLERMSRKIDLQKRTHKSLRKKIAEATAELDTGEACIAAAEKLLESF